MDLSSLTPFLVAEGQKLIDSVVFPELEAVVKSKVTDPVMQALILGLLPVLQVAADNELKKLASS